jgi:hypothetical protein
MLEQEIISPKGGIIESMMWLLSDEPLRAAAKSTVGVYSDRDREIA